MRRHRRSVARGTGQPGEFCHDDDADAVEGPASAQSGRNGRSRSSKRLAIVDIGLGRYITVYHELGDYRGQIFDAEGNRVGDTFLVNVASTLNSSGASPPSLAARPGGGFVAAYMTGSTLDGIFFDVYDADGDRLSGGTIQAAVADTNVTNPSIAMRTDGSFLVTFVRENRDDTFDVVGRRVSANGVVDSNPITIFDSGDTDQTFAEAATLSNGNYVVAYQNFCERRRP